MIVKRKTGAGSFERVVLVALGITPEGKNEVIDFFIVQEGSQGGWEAFVHGPYRRGWTDEGLEVMVTDGSKGSLAN